MVFNMFWVVVALDRVHNELGFGAIERLVGVIESNTKRKVKSQSIHKPEKVFTFTFSSKCNILSYSRSESVNFSIS